MPPSKHTRKSLPPRPPSKSNVNVKDDQDQDQDADGKTVSDASDGPSIDPALLDEEEAPGASEAEDAIAGPPGKPSRGGGAYTGGYNALKTFKGQVYSGMAVGGSHTWNYDQGVWKETKIEPDLWKIDYRTAKRRTRKAPKGSGAPVGTQYHWLIVAHQYVEKMDANTYETHLVGSKYKLAHKSASSNSWSIPTVKAQREREIELLEDAKRRVQGLPPVLAGEKVKVEKKAEKGQQRLDVLLAKAAGTKGAADGKKRKREEEEDGDVKEGIVVKDESDGEF